MGEQSGETAKTSAWRTLPYTGALALLLAAMAVPFCLRQPSDWEKVYVASAKRLITGENIYQEGFVYPPANALLALPVSSLPMKVGVFAWFGVSALALLMLVRNAWRLSSGMKSPTDPGTWRREHLILIAGFACGLPFAFDCFGNRQTDLLVAAMTVTGCLYLRSNRSLTAGLWFGIAAGLKCTPLLWAPYLVLRRRFRAATLLVSVAVGVNLIPDLVFPAASGSRFAEWAHLFLTPMANGQREVGVWAAAPIGNHSLAGVAYRWLALDRINLDGRTLARVSPSRVSQKMLTLTAYGAEAGLLAAAVWATMRRRRVDRPGVVSSEVLEYCMVLLLMLLLSPQSSKPHFCTLMLPAFSLTRIALARRDAVLGLIVFVAVAGSMMCNKDLWGPRIYDFVLWNGGVFWTAVVLFVGCVRARAGQSESIIVPTIDARATAGPSNQAA